MLGFREASRLLDRSGSRLRCGASLRPNITWRCCSGRLPTAARGTSTRALTQLIMAVAWLRCTCCVLMAARGTKTRAHLQLVVATWRCCSGCVPMAARGTRRRSAARLRTAELEICNLSCGGYYSVTTSRVTSTADLCVGSSTKPLD
jgi:hypothetical protein